MNETLVDQLAEVRLRLRAIARMIEGDIRVRWYLWRHR